MIRTLTTGVAVIALTALPLAAIAQHDDTISGDRATDMLPPHFSAYSVPGIDPGTPVPQARSPLAT